MIMKETIVLYGLSILLLTGCNKAAENKRDVNNKKDTTSQAFKPANANEQAIYSRAFNAVIWGMPAVNSELMHESLLKAKGDYNQVVYWSGLINANNQTLTPNPDVIYINPFYDTRKGPVVLEIPPAKGASSITGSIDDGWQTAIEDVGPAGVDKGKGGKYLILPPGYKDKVPAGYFPMPSSTYTGFIILRSNLTDGSKQDIVRAVDYGKKVKIYSYSQAANPPQTTFVDLLQVPFDNIIPYDLRFFETLNTFIQREPWLTRDMAMVDQLKTIGIEKGKAFNPDARTKEILTTAITDAHKWLNEKYEAVFDPPFYEGTHWAIPAKPEMIKAMSENYADPNNYPVDGKAVAYTMAYFSVKHLGSGQFYLLTIKDSNGKSFDGSKQYRLHLPAKVPVKLYWSVTVYDRNTHALLKGVSHFSKASTTPGIQKNEDGSVDLYFGPKAPDGKESNWVPTDPKREFELLARFYGPEKGFFDKVWKMGNVEEMK
ncbi:hypothetical protein Solca_1939 [Solitalea canadensis DSM 3403]|uniref:DUF1254 domain-containing protein n=2 Tax=Solitalea canadensis TaxID=995 RepID=H8KU18_SOLCM|nr:hypothetical protein Solca_1939 [Solitalea canadensis DSM 3403]